MLFALGAGNGLNMERIVDQGQFVFCCETGLDERQGAELPVYEFVDDAQPVRAFGMALAADVFLVAVVSNDRK